jgi:arginyl-tRNA synthetase
VFDYDRMLSFDGNTGPYLQYAHARICSLLRKAATSIDAETGPVCITTPVEHTLSLELLAFGGLVSELEESLDFHRLCGYLYGLATAFTDFYESCPVINAAATSGRAVWHCAH